MKMKDIISLIVLVTIISIPVMMIFRTGIAKNGAKFDSEKIILPPIPKGYVIWNISCRKNLLVTYKDTANQKNKLMIINYFDCKGLTLDRASSYIIEVNHKIN